MDASERGGLDLGEGGGQDRHGEVEAFGSQHPRQRVQSDAELGHEGTPSEESAARAIRQASLWSKARKSGTGQSSLIARLRQRHRAPRPQRASPKRGSLSWTSSAMWPVGPSALATASAS